MHVTLHLGAHRTGATTLQRFLSLNARALAAENVTLWSPLETRRGLLAGLVRRPNSISLELERLGRRSNGRLQIRQHRLERSGVERLIVSEQNLLGTAEGCLRAERLYPWLFERLDRAVPAFHERCDRIVLAIRSYDRFWESLLAQAVMNGWPVPDQVGCDRLVTQPRRWRRVIEEVAAAFPRAELIVWPHERLSGLPERQLAAITGKTMTPGFAARMAGVRSWEARGPSSEDIYKTMAACGRPAPRSIGSDNRWALFDPDQRAALVAQYADDLAWLRDDANGHAMLIERADAAELRKMDLTGGQTPDDREKSTTGLG